MKRNPLLKVELVGRHPAAAVEPAVIKPAPQDIPASASTESVEPVAATKKKSKFGMKFGKKK